MTGPLPAPATGAPSTDDTLTNGPQTGGAPTNEPSTNRPSTNRRALAIALVVVLGLVGVAALASEVATRRAMPTFPPAGVTAPPAGESAAATAAQLTRALAARGLLVEPAIVPYRPAEAPRFATAPRTVLRAILPDDPDHGLIAVYEFISPASAAAAADEQAAYVASGIGRVQFPPDARFIVRVVGSTAVFFSWSPANSPDPRIESIPAALQTLGTGVPIPN